MPKFCEKNAFTRKISLKSAAVLWPERKYAALLLCTKFYRNLMIFC